MCLAIPGKIIELLSEDRNLAMVEVLGVRRKVDLGLLQDEPPIAGDWVLIHVGFAMSKISAGDALQQLRMLTELGESQAALEEVQGYGLGELDEKESADRQAERLRVQTGEAGCDLSTNFVNPN